MGILEFLEDKAAIEAVYHRYCEVIDEKSFHLLTEVFTEDCVGDYRNSNGKIQEGVAPLIAHIDRNMGPGSDCGPTQHNVTNIRVEIDGDQARSKAHFYAVHRGVNHLSDAIYTVWGQYDDDWIRTPEGWRVCRRLYRNFLTDGPVAVIRALGRP